MTDDTEREPDGAADGGSARDPADADGSGRSADGSGRDVDGTRPEETATATSDGTFGEDATSSESGRSDPAVADSTGADSDSPGSNAGGDASGDAIADDPVLDPESIDPAELTVEQRSLHPRIRIVWIVRNVVSALVAGVLAGVAAWALDRGYLVPAAIAVVLLAVGVAFAVLRYRAWRYEVREDALYLERGVLTRVRTVVPTVRVQHVDTRRGPVDRAAGLATVVVYTAGSRGADVSIPGVAADDADDLQRRLKRLAIASEADTSV